MDSTVNVGARSGGRNSSQRSNYNDHKRKQAQKLPIISTPEGLCAHPHAPEVRKRDGTFLNADLGVDEIFETALYISEKQ